MSKVRVGRLVVTLRGAPGADPAQLGRHLAAEVGARLARQAVPATARIRLDLPTRPGATDIRAQVSSARYHIYRGRA